MKKILFSLFIVWAGQLAAQHSNVDIVALLHQRDSLLCLPTNHKNIKLIDSIGGLIKYHADYTYFSYALKIAKDSFNVERLREFNIVNLGRMRYYPWYQVKNDDYSMAFKKEMYIQATSLFIKYFEGNLKELKLIQLPYFNPHICYELAMAIKRAGGESDPADCFNIEDNH